MRQALGSLSKKVGELLRVRRLFLVVFALFVGLLALAQFSRSPVPQGTHQAVSSPSDGKLSKEVGIDAELRSGWLGLNDLPRPTSMAAVPRPSDGVGGAPDSLSYGMPLIAHRAELTMATKEFARARATLEEILERHHGYAAKLRMVGQPAGSLLSATLRVPSVEFEGAVSELKALGNVEREEETADEILRQRAELEARLTNAQNTLRRLQGLLAKKGKDGNQSDIRKQLGNASAAIAQLEAERAASEQRVVFANIFLSMREVIEQPKESLASQFRNAASVGFSDVISTLSAILLFVIGRGPVIVLWAALVVLPIRYAWRKREKWTQREQPLGEA